MLSLPKDDIVSHPTRFIRLFFIASNRCLAGAVRIELTSKESETFVLPLHYAPLFTTICLLPR